MEKKNVNEKYAHHEEDFLIKAINGFGWVSLVILVLIGIKCLSFVYKKSLLQLAIEGFNADTMTVLAMALLGGLLVSLMKISEGYKMKRQAENFSYADYLLAENQRMKEREKVYMKKI